MRNLFLLAHCQMVAMIRQRLNAMLGQVTLQVEKVPLAFHHQHLPPGSPILLILQEPVVRELVSIV